MKSRLILVLLLLLLAACQTGTGTPAQPSPTAAAGEPTAITGDATAEPLPATPAATETLIMPPMTPTPVPTAGALGAGTIVPLAALPEETSSVKEPYAERFFPYLVARRAEALMGPAPMPSTLNVLDIETLASWEVTRVCDDFTCEFTWLSNGSLLWLEEGGVFVADADGNNKRELEAPEGMSEIFGVSANDVAVLRGGASGTLYRLYLPDGTFDAVPEPQANSGALPDFTRQNDLLYFTEDGSVAGLAYDVTFGRADTLRIITLPLEPGSTPTLLAAPTGLQYPGRGGPPPLPPIPLPGTSYWIPRETLWLESGGASIPVPMVIDAATGSLENLERLTGLGERNFRITYTQLSPDRRWLAAFVEEWDANFTAPLPNQPQRFYITPVSDLRAGTIYTGTVEGWQANPPAILLKEYGEGSNALSWLSLSDGAVNPLFPNIEQFVFGNNLSSERALFVQPNRFESTLGVVAPDGTLAGTVEIPLRLIRHDDVNSEQRVDPLFAIGANAYYLGGDASGAQDNTHWLWRWNVEGQ